LWKAVPGGGDHHFRRGYAFAAGEIGAARGAAVIPVTRGQLMHEWNHLLAKLAVRDPGSYERLAGMTRPRPHPLFRVVRGAVESWERV